MPIFSKSDFTLTNHNFSILENASFSISNHEKIVLLGSNGSGKTTLMNFIFENSRVPTGYAKQDLSDLRSNVAEYLQVSDDWWEVSDILHKVFGFQLNNEIKFENLSGGEKMKILISQSLKSKNQLILLDEPTNHLDLASKENLVEFINQDSRAFIIVSHDIDFINTVSDKIINIENQELITYGGDYNFYVQQKDQMLKHKQARFNNAQKALKKVDAEIKSKIRDSQSRKSRMKKKIQSGSSGIPKIVASGLINKGESIISKQMNQLNTRMDSFADIADDNKTTKKRKILFKINNTVRKGSFVSFIDASMNIGGRRLLQDFNFEINSGDRILITGKNGTGKSLLARNLYYKKHSNVEGEIIYGSEYSTFLLDQNQSILDKSLTSIENFQKNITNVSLEEIHKYLFSLNFNLDNIKIPVQNLSGGEKIKLAFSILNASDFDLLLMDEPNNNLDIESKQVLISILNEYQGTFVLVSHDRNFYESVSLNTKYKIESGSLLQI